jgi:hypothetical protein
MRDLSGASAPKPTRRSREAFRDVSRGEESRHGQPFEPAAGLHEQRTSLPLLASGDRSLECSVRFFIHGFRGRRTFGA